MISRADARDGVRDIIGRGLSDREPELWRADIARMTDNLLLLYTELAKPMVYDKGSLIEFRTSVGEALGISGIEKRGSGYAVISACGEIDLCGISEPETLKALLRELLRKEEIDWNYYCDTVPPEER